jgi:hypothetical protein
VCKILAQKVEEEGKCRFAIIPDGIVEPEEDDDEEDDEEAIMSYIINRVKEYLM